MNTDEKHRSPVYWQLAAYEEGWKRDHQRAMACRDWEDAIAVGINIFHMLREREDVWRDQVFRGTTAHSEDDNLDYRTRYLNWLETTNALLVHVLPELKGQFWAVDAACELRQCAEHAEKTLSEWQPPRLSMAVGLREMTLTPEAAAELNHILEEAKTNPPPMPAGPMPQEISAEEFFTRMKRPRP
jgi:hypothetical protein